MKYDGRKIIHVDMDAFYASVEQRDFPEFRGKPLAVGGNRERGVVCAASYEARKFGVRSAMSSKKAYQLCPDLIFTSVRFPVYREVSKQIREIFLSYTDLVEPLSMDEAYLDVTLNKKNIETTTEVANQIRADIFLKTGLTASAGISFNKFLAKTASDIQKPNGYTVILPKNAQNFLDNLPIEKFYGVGKVTAQKMHRFGIRNGLHLRNQTQEFLTKNFGKSGFFYYNIVRGDDEREVNPIQIRKSISAEDTFSNDLMHERDIKTAINEVTIILYDRIEKAGLLGLTITLKIKYNDFSIASKSITLTEPLSCCDEYKEKAFNLFKLLPNDHKPIRLMGLKLSNLITENVQKQYSLF